MRRVRVGHRESHRHPQLLYRQTQPHHGAIGAPPTQSHGGQAGGDLRRPHGHGHSLRSRSLDLHRACALGGCHYGGRVHRTMAVVAVPHSQQPCRRHAEAHERRLRGGRPT
eukprot:Amastigsp_a175553_42.p3 type:complete len:111 gc:universal Amastigsp_a175553_42:400-68(-)